MINPKTINTITKTMKPTSKTFLVDAKLTPLLLTSASKFIVSTTSLFAFTLTLNVCLPVIAFSPATTNAFSSPAEPGCTVTNPGSTKEPHDCTPATANE